MLGDGLISTTTEHTVECECVEGRGREGEGESLSIIVNYISWQGQNHENLPRIWLNSMIDTWQKSDTYKERNAC